MSEDGSLSLGIGLPLVAFLLLANAIFVATEFALVTVRRTRIDQLSAEGNRSAQRVKDALGNLDYYIAAAQLGITMASIILGAVGEPVLARIIEPPVELIVGSFAPAVSHTVAIAVAFLFVTSLHIVLGEFVPKTIALERAEATSLFIALPLGIFVKIFGPVIWALNATGNGLLRLLGMDLRPIGDEHLTAEDLAHSFESSASAGLISRRELTLTRHLLDLTEIESRELMVPRSRISAISIDATLEDVARRFAEQPFTRYPVQEDSIDQIVGTLDARRLLLTPEHERPDRWQDNVQDAAVLPDTVSVNEALETMQRHGGPMVILVDEYGGTAGAITQFDIVKYLAVDLPNELPLDERHLQPQRDTFPHDLSGLMPVAELRDLIDDAEFPDSDASTLGGLVTEAYNRIPSVGDTIDIAGLECTVLEMDQYRVARVRIDRADDDAHNDDPEVDR